MAEPQPNPSSRTDQAGPIPLETAGGRNEWSRKYPPLVTILVALVLAIAVLPSALNLPQTNPTQTLEYAPVPPDDTDQPPPADGNLSSLGLGSSSGVAEDAEGGTGAGESLPPLPGGKGVNPSTKRCVGNPPRQTEDPVAPPCVAYFDGDNFGATYQGVTREEVRLLVYIDSGIAETGGSKGQEVRPQNEFFDLFEPPEDDEHLLVEGYRGWQRYFNERFQTYGRVVHFFLHFSSAARSPEARRADAAEGYARVKPFAVLTDANENEVDYVAAMARRGVLNFGSYYGKQTDFFTKFPKLVWGYQPTLEYSARTYSSFVCQKVVGKPAVLTGNPGQNGNPRKLALFHTTDENFPGLIRLAELVEQQVEECGGEIATTITFPTCCYAQDNGTRPDYAAQNAAHLRQEGITTVLWAGGIEGKTANATFSSGYYPEWIVLGDGQLDGNSPNRYATNSNAFHERAIVVTPEVFEPAIEQQRCYQAFREVNQTRPKSDMSFICEAYRNLFQLFVGIQVAGPRLGPTSIDKGFHAIPEVRSEDPTSPACFYNTGDYTCVKDAQFEIWNANGQAPGDNRPGCWMIIDGAKRYLPGEWPPGNIDAQGPGQECNGVSFPTLLNPA